MDNNNNKEEPANRQHFRFFHVGKLMLLLITVSVLKQKKKKRKEKNNMSFLEIVYLESSDHCNKFFSRSLLSISYLQLKSIVKSEK